MTVADLLPVKDNFVIVVPVSIDGIPRTELHGIAIRHFNCYYGMGSGFHGNTYVIPTLSCCKADLEAYLDRFVEFVGNNPEKDIYLADLFTGTRFGPDDFMKLKDLKITKSKCYGF